MTFLSEHDRLETFRIWSNEKPSPLELVQAGFHNTGSDDTVACSFCHCKISNWKHKEDPISEHLKLSPNCIYIREYLRKQNSWKSTRRLKVADTSESNLWDLANESILVNPTQIRVASTSQKPPPSRTLNPIQGTDSHIVPVIQRPFVRDFTKEDHRLQSFVRWTGQVHPRQLAHAGLYYLGNSDRVQCFSCKTIFRDWVAGDDPWIEHSKWYPDCPFIQLCLGKDVVKEIHKHVMRQRENRTFRAFDDVVDGPNCHLVF